MVNRFIGLYQSLFANGMGLAATGILIFLTDLNAGTVGFGIMFLMNFGGMVSYIVRMQM